MATQLNTILKRNKSNLKQFILKNKLTSYLSLVEYCKQRSFIPCTEEEYNEVTTKEKKDDRQNSNTQKKRKPRSSSKRKQSTQRLLESDDNGKNWRMAYQFN